MCFLFREQERYTFKKRRLEVLSQSYGYHIFYMAGRKMIPLQVIYFNRIPKECVLDDLFQWFCRLQKFDQGKKVLTEKSENIEKSLWKKLGILK